MSAMIDVVLRAGLISPAQLEEMRRISPHVIDGDVEVRQPLDLERAAQLVEEVLTSEHYVLMRETDLESIQQYYRTAQEGFLHLELSAEQVTDTNVTFGRTRLGAFTIPWRGESIKDMLTNGMSYLLTSDGRVYFKDVRELCYGENTAFMVCVPSAQEAPRVY